MTPLAKRIPRELRMNIGKYLGIFLLMFACVAMISGFLMAAHSIEVLIDGMRDTYNIEDGRVTTAFEADDDQLDAAEAAADDVGGVTFYDNYSITVPLVKDADDNGTNRNVRTTTHQETFNVAAYAEGSVPEAADEIALDRCFAANNGIAIGDGVTLGGVHFTVCGIMTEADSQALFENNSDFTLNAMTFGVAELSASGTAALRDAGYTPTYTYSFCFVDRGLSVAERIDVESDMVEALSDEGAQVTDLIDSSTNQAIGYAADDVVGDAQMMRVLMYIIIVLMAFAFVVITSSTIEEESSVIGTLLASGYRTRELVTHYMALPCLVGLVACLAGTICGVTLLETPMKNLYYTSYSLPPYQLSWDWSIFFESATVPFIVLAVITFLGIAMKMGHTPLQFLRHEVRRSGSKRSFSLPERMRFTTRFRLRVFLRNIGNFATLFLGIAFASLLLLFGLCASPTMAHYANDLRNNVVAQHEYSLKAPLELTGTDDERASWVAVDRLMSIDSDVLNSAEDAADDLEDAADAFKALPSATHLYDIMDTQDELEDAIEDIADELGVSIGEATDLIEDATDVDYDDEDVHPVNTVDNGAEKIAQAEKYAVYTLEYDRSSESSAANDALRGSSSDRDREGNGWESITVYGVQPDSRYWENLDIGDGRIVFGNGVVDKFSFAAGDTVSFYDKFENETYEFTVGDGDGAIWGTESDMSIYLSLDDFNRIFDHPDDYFNAYASDEELQLDNRYLESDLTPDDMDAVAAQMERSMGGMMSFVLGLAVFIYLVFMYLLTKAIIDRSARSISYMKVFGYRDREISQLYIRSITWCVIASLILCIPFILSGLNAIWVSVMMGYNGNLQMFITPGILVECVVAGIATYAVVALLHLRSIRRVPLSIALKVQE